ncbi:putative polysaccharide biosynthesis protein [Clostridium hydrogeniformans]|uniref:putative polysaccharide biosynthesis protein n=1 Tax=Clostridium hydrogeniformans TaxID=349933 RepID=UPI0004855132|nr:polysaccharide biosynthesis protein [Clostridium hydrogeniformans]
MKSQSASKGFAILSISGIMCKILSLLSVPLINLIIHENGYGMYFSATTIYTAIYVSTNSGIQTAISRQVSQFIALENNRAALKTFKMARALLLLSSTIICVLVLVFIVPISKITAAEDSIPALIAIMPSLVITSVLVSYRGYFQGRNLVTPIAVSQIFEQIINVVFSVVLTYILYKYGVKAGAAGGSLGTTLSTLVATIYVIFIYRKHRFNRIEGPKVNVKTEALSNKYILKNLLQFSLPLTFILSIQYWGDIIDMSIVKNILGSLDLDSDTLFALLGKYKTLIGVPLIIIASLCSVVVPSLSRSIAIKDNKSIKSKMSFTFRVCFIISIPSAVGLFILSEPIYKVVFIGRTQGWDLLKLGAIVVVFMSVVQIQTIILQCLNKFKFVFISSMISILTRIICNYILVSIPTINIKGAIIGNILCYLIPMILNLLYLNKVLHVKISLFKYSLKPIISSLFMSVTIYALLLLNKIFLNNFITESLLSNLIFLVIAIILGISVYGYSLVLLRGITKNDLNYLSPKIPKMLPSFIRKNLK